jgi:predicted  nucleic acid-binding Zn-ribbon protein
MTEAKVALGQAEERRRAVRQQLAAVRRSLEEARAQQATAASDIRSLRQRIEQSQIAQLTGESAIADLYLARQDLAEKRTAASRQLDEVRKSLAELDAAAQAAGHELHAAEESLHHAQVTQNELRVRQEGLVQRVADEHHIDLPKLHETNPPNAARSTSSSSWRSGRSSCTSSWAT